MSAAGGPDLVTNGLVLHLDAASRRSYNGGAIWRDLARNNNGTLINGSTFNSSNGGSIVFDGVDDYVTCGPVLNFGSSTSIATILVWAKGLGCPISNQRTNGSDHGWIQTNITENGFSLYIDAYDGPPYGESFSAPRSSTPYASLSNQWNLYNIRINRPIHQYIMGINNYFTIYTRNFTVGSYLNFNIIEIGRINNFSYNTSYFNGQISNVFVYNRFLTDQEILQNYNATRSRFGV